MPPIIITTTLPFASRLPQDCFDKGKVANEQIPCADLFHSSVVINYGGHVLETSSNAFSLFLLDYIKRAFTGKKNEMNDGCMFRAYQNMVFPVRFFVCSWLFAAQ